MKRYFFYISAMFLLALVAGNFLVASSAYAELVSRDFINVSGDTRYVCTSDNSSSFDLYGRNNTGGWVKINPASVFEEHRRLVRLWKNRFLIRTLLRGNSAPQTLKAKGRWITNRQIVKGIKDCGSTVIDTDNNICGIVADGPRTSLRVINGEPCRAGSSSVVKLEINYRNSISVCSGTVITPFTVLTAAHCLTGRPVSVTISTPSGVVETNDFIAHPEFRTDAFAAFETYDAALVYSSVPLNTKMNSIVVRAPKAGTGGIIAGYGLTENNTSEELNAAQVVINRVFPSGLETIYDGKGNNTNTCFGDSGGPLLVFRKNRWLVAGIISNGIKADCSQGDIARYANVASNTIQDFIAVNIR